MKQVITIETGQKTGTKRWVCDSPGWVPYETIVLKAEHFPEDTTMTVEFDGELVDPLERTK